MTLDEYSLAGSKDSFTYWIESKLDELGGTLEQSVKMPRKNLNSDLTRSNAMASK